MNRRQFLAIVLAGALAPSCARRRSAAPRVGLALGGGGANGLAHVLMLEALDELGVRPHRLAGTSIGAVMAVLYASGMSGSDIRALINRLTVSEQEDWFDSLFREDILRWISFVEPTFGKGGVLDSHDFVDFLEQTTGCSTFADLRIPLQVVAADFWARESVVFSNGALAPAMRSTIAVPGLFSPVRHRGRVLVDGGLVNPVPYDLLFDECDLVIAVDVLGQRIRDGDEGPSYFETMFNSFQIMQASIMKEKRRWRAADIYIKPDVRDVRVLEFYKFESVYRQARPAQHELRARLRDRIPDSALSP